MFWNTRRKSVTSFSPMFSIVMLKRVERFFCARTVIVPLSGTPTISKFVEIVGVGLPPPPPPPGPPPPPSAIMSYSYIAVVRVKELLSAMSDPITSRYIVSSSLRVIGLGMLHQPCEFMSLVLLLDYRELFLYTLYQHLRVFVSVNCTLKSGDESVVPLVITSLTNTGRVLSKPKFLSVTSNLVLLVEFTSA